MGAAIASSTPGSSSPPHPREPEPNERVLGRRGRTGEFDPDTVGILHESEERSALHEGRMGRPNALRQQLAVAAFDVLAMEGDVIQGIAAAVGSREEFGAFRVPVEFEAETGTRTPKLNPAH